MLWKTLITAQTAILAGTLYATTLWPFTGDPAVLVSVVGQPDQDKWRWLGKEGADLLEVDGTNHSVTFVVPSQASLLRALARGYLPVAAQASSCAFPEDSETSFD